MFMLISMLPLQFPLPSAPLKQKNIWVPRSKKVGILEIWRVPRLPAENTGTSLIEWRYVEISDRQPTGWRSPHATCVASTSDYGSAQTVGADIHLRATGSHWAGNQKSKGQKPNIPTIGKFTFCILPPNIGFCDFFFFTSARTGYLEWIQWAQPNDGFQKKIMC